ncbi:MAG: hypothetical protein ACRD0Z_07820 [Acidimicrobiales bacterium]
MIPAPRQPAGRSLRRQFPVATATLLAIAYAVAWALEPAKVGILTAVFGALLGLLTLRAATGTLRPSRRQARRLDFEAIAGPPRSLDVARPGELDKLEQIVSLSPTWAAETEYQLRPMLAELASSALARQGVEPDDEARAAAVLGAELYGLVGPSHRPATDPRGPGLPLEALDRLVTRLEEL